MPRLNETQVNDGVVNQTVQWHVGGLPVLAEDLTVTPTSVSLSFQVPESEIDRWREYDRAGNVQTERGFGGSFRTIDRAGRNSVEIVRVPDDQQPPYIDERGFVTSYQEQQVASDRFRISITLQRRTNRDSEYPTVSQTGDFEFNLSTGTVGLDSEQVSRPDRAGSTTGGQVDLSLAVSDEQAGTLLDNLGFVRGVVERSVGDGEDFLVDESDNSRQTVTLSTPTEAVLSDGDYLVTGWQVSENAKTAGRRWQFDLTLENT